MITVHGETMPHIQGNRLRQNGLKDLHSSSMFARLPVIGLLMFIVGSLMFGALTYNLVAHGPLLEWDRALANTLPAIAQHSSLFIKILMFAGFTLGEEVIVILDIILAVYFFRKRYWQEFAMVTIGWAGTALLFFSLSHFFDRARPPLQVWITLNMPGYPSGHGIAVVTFYGLLAYLLTPRMPSAFWKVLVALIALLIIGFVGFSRVFTGGHYLTDILAGYAVGFAWSGAVYTLIEIYFQRKKTRTNHRT
jgi:membrane-associated phospholipid phosphatase